MKPGRKISFEENARRCLVSVHDRPVLRDVAHRDNGQSNHSFLSKAEQSCPKGKFGYPWPMRLKKVSPNNHLRRCPSMSSCMEYQLGPACALEGLFEALPRFLSRRLAPGRCRQRAHFLSTNQQENRQSPPAAILVDAVTGEPVRPIRP